MPREETLPPFLDVDPPHWAARGLAYILIALFVTALIVSLVIQIPETVSGPFVLIPKQGTDPVRASDDGIVQEVRVTEGAMVRSGDPIFIIQSQAVGDRSAELRTLQMQAKGAQDKLNIAKMKYESQRLADTQEEKSLKGHVDYLNRMIGHKKKQLALSIQLEENHEKLYLEGITNQAQYAEYQMEASKVALELEQLETENAETQASIQKLLHESEAQLAEFRSLQQTLREETESNQIRIDALKNELAFSSGDKLTVPAPCSGTILGLRTKSSGAVVQEGEVLCELACTGEKLQAELTVPEMGLARIKPGQGVKLLYDAFPYQRYGVRYGTVRWISPASVVVSNVSVFRILIDVEEDVVPSQDQLRMLMPGMGGMAQVVVDRRSLISFAFEPIRKLKSILEKPPEKRTVNEIKQ